MKFIVYNNETPEKHINFIYNNYLIALKNVK